MVCLRRLQAGGDVDRLGARHLGDHRIGAPIQPLQRPLRRHQSPLWSPRHGTPPSHDRVCVCAVVRVRALNSTLLLVQKAKDMSRVEIPITQFQTTQIKTAKVTVTPFFDWCGWNQMVAHDTATPGHEEQVRQAADPGGGDQQAARGRGQPRPGLPAHDREHRLQAARGT